MAVYVGSARIDERGKISGGRAGDQTGNEVGGQTWYLHKKGWVVIRAKDPAARLKIAAAMKAACDNNHIGYDQSNRSGLWNAIKSKGYNPALCTIDTETDCSALVRVCCAYGGIIAPDFNTSLEVKTLKATNKFDIIEDSKYTNSSDYLLAGDILVTKTKGHTVVVLNDGPKANGSKPAASNTTSSNKDCYPAYTGKSNSIDDVLAAIGVPDKYLHKAANRKPIAEKNGIKNYSGTASQNLSLVKLAKAGNLKKI